MATVCSLIRVDTGQPFIAQATPVTNGDGSTSFQLPNNAGFAGQQFGEYGVRNDSANAGMYQRATVNGAAATFVLQAPSGEIYVATYLYGSGQVFPA